MKQKVLFYNDWHFGDIHMSRNYVKDIISILGTQNYEFYSYNTNNPYILSDIDNLTHTDKKTGFDIQINTWIGQMTNKIPFNGCNFNYYYKIMIEVYNSLGIKDMIKDISFYVPQINFTKIDKDLCDKFINDNEFFIIICNNDIKSGQSDNFDMGNLIDKISDKFTNYSILITNYKDNIKKKKNIFFIEDLTQNKKFNLLEISYISKSSKLILGRSSGPYSFCINKENYERSVPFYCLTNKEYDCWQINHNEKIIWSNDYDVNNIIKKLNEFL